MQKGHLSQYVKAIAAKRLSAVEITKGAKPKKKGKGVSKKTGKKKKSNQHEFNSNEALRAMLGTNTNGETEKFIGRLIWMGDESEVVTATADLSWYDTRFGQKDRSPEWRLYFQTTDVTDLAREGDLLVVAKLTDDSLLCIITPSGSSAESQIQWLFGLSSDIDKSFVSRQVDEEEDKPIDFAARLILDELGIEIEDPESQELDSALQKYKGILPTTDEFSALARKTCKNVDPIGDPDGTLIAWLIQEEKLFKRMEYTQIEEKIKSGFSKRKKVDVDGFIKFSLHIQNRRKSRAGRSLENHLAELFSRNDLKFDREKKTENKSKPDFLFPSVTSYHDLAFDKANLDMLGVKRTCKDRWRQILSEAAKIPSKFLLTLEPRISVNQTNEMKVQNVILVVPSSIQSTYLSSQQIDILTLREFIQMRKRKQGKA